MRKKGDVSDFKCEVIVVGTTVFQKLLIYWDCSRTAIFRVYRECSENEKIYNNGSLVGESTLKPDIRGEWPD